MLPQTFIQNRLDPCEEQYHTVANEHPEKLSMTRILHRNMISLSWVMLVMACWHASSEAFVATAFQTSCTYCRNPNSMRITASRKFTRSIRIQALELDSLMDMDVVFYRDAADSDANSDGSTTTTTSLKLGAVQEDGTLLPLSAWSDEPAFGTSIEFLVDEEDRMPGGLKGIVIESLVPQESLSYGSRQVGGGKGPGNPHGEESEQLYYVEQDLLEGVEVVVKPELEILW